MAPKELFEKAFEFGVVGGITSVLQGGKFGHGFVSAGVNPYLGAGLGGDFGQSLGQGGQVIAQIVLSGAVSAATGGKFKNGAAYAAFSIAVEGVGKSVEG